MRAGRRPAQPNTLPSPRSGGCFATRGCIPRARRAARRRGASGAMTGIMPPSIWATICLCWPGACGKSGEAPPDSKRPGHGPERSVGSCFRRSRSRNARVISTRPGRKDRRPRNPRSPRCKGREHPRGLTFAPRTKGRTRWFASRYCGSRTTISPNFVCQRSFFYLGGVSRPGRERPAPLPRSAPLPSLATPRGPVLLCHKILDPFDTFWQW